MELTEQILSNLEYGDLARVMCVSKNIRASIEGSATLRQAMWLAPTVPVRTELGVQKLHPYIYTKASSQEDDRGGYYDSGGHHVLYSLVDGSMTEKRNALPNLWKRMPCAVPAYTGDIVLHVLYDCFDCEQITYELYETVKAPASLHDLLSIILENMPHEGSAEGGTCSRGRVNTRHEHDQDHTGEYVIILW